MTFKAPYSRIERLLHNVAFGHLGLQKMLASIEDDLFAKQFQNIEVGPPVFITSLPRAATTCWRSWPRTHYSSLTHTATCRSC